LGVILTRELEKSVTYRERLPKILKQFGVFVFVSATWVFFRADSMETALLIFRRMATTAWTDPQMPALMILLMAVVWVYQYLLETPWRNWLAQPVVRVGMASAMLLYMCLCSAGGGASFTSSSESMAKHPRLPQRIRTPNLPLV